MSERRPPFFTWGIAIACGFAVVGAAVIAFIFVPFFSPDTDQVLAFTGALAFMLIVMAAGYAARSRQ